MRRLSIHDLPLGERHIVSGIVSGDYLTKGGIGFKAPGERSHDTGCSCKCCDGQGKHIHKDEHEVFIILQGKARIEINGVAHGLVAGDVVICEPGEDHHLVSDEKEPCVNIYLHAGDK